MVSHTVTALTISRAQTVRSAKAMSLTVLVYDWLILLDDEVEYMWKSKSSFIKILYFIIRYPTFSDVCLSMAYYFSQHITASHCKTYDVVAIYITAVGTALTELVLIWRTYALWNKSRKVLATLLIIWTIWVCGDMYPVVKFAGSLVFLDQKLPGVPGCILANGDDIVFIPYVTLLANEVVIVIFTMIKTIGNYRSTRSVLAKRLYNDVGMETIILFRIYLSFLGSQEGRPLLELPEKHADLVVIESRKMNKTSTIILKEERKSRSIVRDRSSQGREDADEDLSMIVADQAEKEFTSEGCQSYGRPWATNVHHSRNKGTVRFLERSKAALKDCGEDELEATAGECPVCGEMGVFWPADMRSASIVCVNLQTLQSCTMASYKPSGYGDEQSNIRVEAEFEKAAVKDLRPCKVHLTTRSASVEVIDIDSGSSSNEDLPDISTILKNHAANNANNKTKGKGKGRVVDSDNDDDIGMHDDAHCVGRGGSGRRRERSRTDTPHAADNGGASEDVLRTWRADGVNVKLAEIALCGMLEDSQVEFILLQMCSRSDNILYTLTTQ
ncbi:hypothetical protein NM688_g6266 [Phlebia brevispora]|uniref:Uncharacterized protein n=1 Tax=Phlebia brevispora TaxID=194682 RepID=A0ACC1SHX9_9APHY|nr:hypothetical protein NM688_g6266 [Phlebia brevispora]